MILWTIQPEEVYELIQRTGVYHCDYGKSGMGEPPGGVSYPVWAWYMWEGARKKPDLRQKRWGYGWKGERFACMEIDIPEEKLILSDYDTWSIILLDGLLADTEEEEESLEEEYEAMPPEARREYKYRNWKNVFDLAYVDNGWIHRGDSIQATFWELRKEDIKKVRFFTAATPKPKYLEAEE